MFVSTLDDLATVPAYQRAFGPPRISPDRVTGPGTNTSSTTAAMLTAAKALAASGLAPEHDLVFAAVAQEETGLNGMRRLYAEWRDRAVAFVDILGDGRSITYGALGIHWWKVHVDGPGGHTLQGGLPNVNQGIARAVDRIFQLPQPGAHPEARTVLNVAVLSSGEVFNHKPETGWFSLDIRSLDGNELESIEKAVRAILREVGAETGVSFEMEAVTQIPGAQIPGMADSDLVRTSAAIARSMDLQPTFSNAGSANLNVALAGGTPAIGLGGGRGGQRGSLDEWADRAAMMRQRPARLPPRDDLRWRPGCRTLIRRPVGPPGTLWLNAARVGVGPRVRQTLQAAQPHRLQELERVAGGGESRAQEVVEGQAGAAPLAAPHLLAEVYGHGSRLQVRSLGEREVVGAHRAHGAAGQQVAQDRPGGHTPLGCVRAVQDLVEEEEDGRAAVLRVGGFDDVADPQELRHEERHALRHRVVHAHARAYPDPGHVHSRRRIPARRRTASTTLVPSARRSVLFPDMLEPVTRRKLAGRADLHVVTHAVPGCSRGCPSAPARSTGGPLLRERRKAPVRVVVRDRRERRQRLPRTERLEPGPHRLAGAPPPAVQRRRQVDVGEQDGRERSIHEVTPALHRVQQAGEPQELPRRGVPRAVQLAAEILQVGCRPRLGLEERHLRNVRPQREPSLLHRSQLCVDPPPRAS